MGHYTEMYQDEQQEHLSRIKDEILEEISEELESEFSYGELKLILSVIQNASSHLQTIKTLKSVLK